MEEKKEETLPPWVLVTLAAMACGTVIALTWIIVNAFGG